MFISYNRHKIITAVSDHNFDMVGNIVREVPDLPKPQRTALLGKKLDSHLPKKDTKQLRVACICNWNDACGISTYTQFLMKAIAPQVKEIAIFSEHNDHPTNPDEAFVSRCWKRGESMAECVQKCLAWQPDFVIVQHEFGIFPKATYFLQMLQMLREVPYVVTLHSVYEHLDKTICTSAIENIVVHSAQGQECLRRLGHNQNIFVLPHGCVKFPETTELWNIFQTPYTLVQFGFGFFYKGVDRAIDAVHYLKNFDAKFKDIYYIYLCSDSGHFSAVHNDYYYFLLDKIEKLGLNDNVSIIRKFHSQQTINNYLRCAKVALFPYITDPKHVVYGASGAIRIAMANKIPVIASEGHMFDDLEGIVPRPGNAVQLAQEIDEVFSNERYKNSLLERTNKYVAENSWEFVAKKYLDVYREL